MKLHFPNPADLLNFTFTVEPDEGMYKNGESKGDEDDAVAAMVTLMSTVHRSRLLCLHLCYPLELPARSTQSQVHPKGETLAFYDDDDALVSAPPTIRPLSSDTFLPHTQLYHPNIDLQGNVCLNVLREDWKPIMDLNNVFPGLLYLFLEPNGGDPLNKEAADELRRDKAQFASTVKRTMAGGSVKGVAYDKVVMK